MSEPYWPIPLASNPERATLMMRRTVTIPDFQTFMRPVLEFHADGKPHPVAEVREVVADMLGVSTEERKILLPSGTPRYANRIAWAVTHLAQAGLLARPARGVTELTSRGQEVLDAHPDRVDMRILKGFAEYLEFRNRTRSRRSEPTADGP